MSASEMLAARQKRIAVVGTERGWLGSSETRFASTKVSPAPLCPRALDPLPERVEFRCSNGKHPAVAETRFDFYADTTRPGGVWHFATCSKHRALNNTNSARKKQREKEERLRVEEERLRVAEEEKEERLRVAEEEKEERLRVAEEEEEERRRVAEEEDELAYQELQAIKVLVPVPCIPRQPDPDASSA